MRKSIARKLAGLLAIVVMTTTFASDYNSIGARASEENAIEAETLETATDAEASEESEVVEDSQEVTEEAEEVVEEVSETTEDSEEAAEAEEQTEEAAEPAEDAEETSTEGSEEVASEETPAEETPAEETPAEDAAAEETAEDVSVVNITYTAGVGGTVSIESEQVTDAAAGATATADDGYKFVNWTNEDEVIVSEEATFTPSGDQLVDGAVYYANFMKAEKEFSCEKEIDGIKITLSADKGVLPADVELNIVKVENEVEEQITELLDEKTGDDVEVAKTYSYDITFKAESAKTEENPEGIVQPENDKTVEIKFSQIEEAASADTELAVYHVEDDISDADIVAEADSKTATDVVVNAEHFSIYSVVLYEDHLLDLIHDDHEYPVKISVVDELGHDITGDKKVTVYLDRESLLNSHYYISTADAAKEMVNFVDNQIFTFVRATCNGDEFDRFNKADGDNKVKLYNGNKPVANLDAVKNSGITFEYAHVTTDHLDFGFMDPEEYNYYKNNEAVITAKIGNGKPIQMYSTGQDADIKSYEYRAKLSNYGYTSQYAIATETIKFTIKIGDQVFEKTTTTKDNAEAAERCYTNHKQRKQDAYGFDYVFSFADDFKLKGDVVYHKNDGTDVKWSDTVKFGWNTTTKDYSVLSIDTIANKESAPEKFNVYADHVFKGWGTKDASGKINLVYAYNNGKFTPASCEVTKDRTLDLYAVWEEDSYTVTYKTDKPGTFAEQNKKAIKNTKTPRFEGEKTCEKGYEFDGWDDASTQKVENFSDTELANKTVTGNVTYVAQWKGSKAEYTIKVYLGVSGNYADPISYKSTDKLPDNDKKTVEDHYGKAYVGEKFAPEFADTYGDYSLVKNKGKLVLDKVSADSKENVLEVYYNVEYPKVSFYVLKPGKSIPADSKGKDVKDYFPEKDNADYPYDKWSGLAVDLYSLPESQLDTNHNLWAYNSETGIISDAITEATVIKYVPKETINADLKDCLNVKVLAQNGEVRDATYDDIQWYVYKNTSGDHYKGGDKSYHIDGYIKGVLINVTYHSNYGNEYTAVDKARTGEKYSVKGTTVGNTTFEREGYTFVGWNTQKDGKGTTYKANQLTPVLMASTDFYAMWERIPYTTTYQDEADDEGKHEGISAQTQYYGDKTYTIENPDDKTDADGNVIKEFKGWKSDVAGDNHVYSQSEIADITVTRNQTYTAYYEIVGFYKNYYINYYFQKADGSYDYIHTQPSKDNYVNGWYKSTTKELESQIVGPVYVNKDTGTKVSISKSDLKEKVTRKNIEYRLVDKGEANWWDGTIRWDETTPVVLNVYYNRTDFDTELDVYALNSENYYNGTKQNSTSGGFYDASAALDNYVIVVEANVDNDGITNVSENPKGYTLNKKVTKVTIKNKKSGETYVIDATGTKDGDVVKDARFGKIRVHHGTYKILPLPVTLKSADLSKEFDGTALVNGDTKLATEKGFIDGEGATYTFTGSQTVAGESANSFTLTAKEGTDFNNYKFIDEEGNEISGTYEGADGKTYNKYGTFGTLTVTPRDKDNKIKIKVSLSTSTDDAGRDTTVYYNGAEQTANLKVDVYVDTHTITDALNGEGNAFEEILDNAKNTLASMFGGLKVSAAEPEEVKTPSDRVNIDPEVIDVLDGKLTVTVSGLYVTGGHGKNAGDYPIYLHTNDMDITMNIGGKNVDITDEFEIEIVKDDNSANTASNAAVLGASDEDANADETVAEVADAGEIIGYLHVLKKDVVLTSASATKVYDGTPLTAPTVTASENTEKTGFVEGEGAAYNVTGTITEPGTVSNTFTYALQENTLAANYNISTEEGTLTVTKQTEENPPEEDDKKNDKKDDKKDKKEKNESTNNAPFDDSSYDDSSNDSVNSAPANNGEVLGVNREADGQGEEAAVLGARRAGTEDSTNSARVIVILIAAGVVASILAVSRKKKEDKNN